MSRAALNVADCESTMFIVLCFTYQKPRWGMHHQLADLIIIFYELMYVEVAIIKFEQIDNDGRGP
jgi:hypothetical protein